MSGLEGIAGLSLACNVMQLISFGHEAISICRRIHESGSPEPGLSEHAENLKAVCDGLEKSLGKRPTPVATTTPTTATTRAPTMEKRLLDLAAKCVKNARDLEEEMNFLSPNQPGKLRALVAAPKILWRKRRLERLKGNLDDAQKVMDTSILERLFARVEALYQANNQGFSDLSQELQQFITDHAASNSILRNAIETQTKGIQDHVTMESSKTQNEIKSHVSLKLSSHEISIKNHVLSTAQDVQDTFSQRMTSREDSKAKEQAYQQLLKSLKYPGMNERRNQISESHPRTFRWIFSDSMYLSDSESGYSTEGNSSAYSDEPVNVETSSTRSDEPSELSEGSDGTSYSVPRPWDSFVDWLKDDTQKTYWISGKPGSGKSTLMKYIEKNSRTMECCNSASHCISHYLWRPGTLMQQSIKGVLCSLLHQILDLRKGHAMQVLGRQPNLSTKDADTDWTVKELEKTLLDFIRESTCKYVVLLDGLDEVADTSDDGVDRLLDLIDELVSTNQVKVCVSSRPEPALKRFLERSPMLKIQDLTSRDIHLLTRERLEAIGIDLENDESDDLSELICEKAEGVFIWVILVLNSLKRGLDNYDDMDTLYSRVVSLPRDLTKLYKEMWSRMKEDSDLYRRKTVLLFYMAMEFKTQSNRVHIWKPNANLLGLAISTDDEMLKSFMAGQELPDMELLWQKWHRLGRKLPAICAGLLDITDPEEAFSSLNDYESKFKPWGKTGIGFTHRTAIDFICNSEEGKELFGPYVPKQDDLLSRAIKTDLMLRRIINRTETSVTVPTDKPHLSLKYDRRLLPSFDPFEHLAGISSHRTAHNLLTFTYQCLETMDLNLKNQESTSDSRKVHHAFIAHAFFMVEFANWAEETLQAATAGIEEVTLVESLALRSGCEGIVAFGGYDDIRSLGLKCSFEGNSSQLTMIQRVLRKYSNTRRGLNDSIIQPLQLASYRDVSTAWRCVLSHTLDKVLVQKRFSQLADDAERPRWWSNIVEVVQSFLSASVLEDLKGQKYLVSIVPSNGRVSIISEEGTMQTMQEEIILEVNDAAMLAVIIEAAQSVLGSISLTKLLLTPGYCPIALPKLVVNQQEWAGGWRIFNEILQDESMDGQRLLRLVLSGKLPTPDPLISESGGPSILRVRNIGRHWVYSSALRAIGHELSTVNKDYASYHDYLR
ncbi:hypothetical protein CMEL01_09378 [Colletotrichum melonis]|uniref:Nephrocystin 3-like N-terminal domain-containing protein n=1 Tax=Colletotrichum melonis TaxID=1209925 RepID=A0AAI9XH98_9PEZI|nr:hypothetical protein CMEL01_09378 [Colletotrichum melonis]